ARETRVCKFNLGTELRQTFGQALRQTLAEQPEVFDRLAILKSTMPAMRESVSDILKTITLKG
ncbi:MAG: class II fructose-bisphosphate aldolase, partial [Pseudomonadota bacterium]